MKIEAEIKNIKKILVDDDCFYQIPDYQRPYSWDKDNLDDLIEDLTSSYLAKTEDTYFCGSLVLVNSPVDNRFDIIDGQQRTTTFTIIACVIRDLYQDQLSAKARKYINNSIQDEFEDDRRKLKFLTNDKYQIDFEETVLKGIKFEETKQIEKIFSDNKYLQNAHFLKNFITDRISEHNIDIDNFVVWFYECVVLTVITCPNQDSAIQIFNVLNDRGMPLSSIDILKASLMQKLNSKEDRVAFKAKWEEINTNLNFSGFELDSMLNTYLYYKLSTNPKSRLDKELIQVFSDEGKSSLEIIKEISDFSKSYIKALIGDCKYLYCLKYLKHKIYWTSILSTAIFTGYTDIEKLKKYLVSYYYQNWIAGATVARIKQTSFNIIKLIKKGKPVDAIYEEMQDNLSNYSTNKSFIEELEGSNVYGRKWDRALLLLIEYFSSDDSTLKFVPLGATLHLEHVLPQKTTDYWEALFDQSAREVYTNSLANLTLLSLRKNVQAQNYTFEEKKSVYKDRDLVTSSFLITQDILKFDSWDEHTIQDRELSLLNTAKLNLDIF